MKSILLISLVALFNFSNSLSSTTVGSRAIDYVDITCCYGIDCEPNLGVYLYSSHPTKAINVKIEYKPNGPNNSYSRELIYKANPEFHGKTSYIELSPFASRCNQFEIISAWWSE